MERIKEIERINNIEKEHITDLDRNGLGQHVLSSQREKVDHIEYLLAENKRLTKELNNYKRVSEHIVKFTPNADDCYILALDATKYDGTCKHYWQYNEDFKEVCSDCGALKQE